MIIKLTEEEYDTCSKFAGEVVETNKDCYARRNQENVPKIIDDIKVGKLAEVACKKLLVARGMTITTDVDFAIYGKKKKSFSSDLVATSGSKEWLFHVKCMKEGTASRFGLSWSFQVQDSIVFDPSENDYLMLCQLNDYFSVDVKTVTLARNVVDCWKDPKLTKLHGIKKVLYWSDLEQLESVKKL